MSVTETVTRLQELQIRRKHHIRVQTRLFNGAGALVRRALGWRKDSPDAEEIKTRATKLVKAFLSGKAVPPTDDLWPDIIADLVVDLEVARQQLDISAQVERRVTLAMEKLARTLPACAFVKGVKGFGDLGFAVLIGEAGDLGNYAKVDGLRARVGLAPYEGKALSNWRRKGGLTQEEWSYLHYKPQRRAEVFAVIEDPLFRHQAASRGPYYAVYLARRARTAVTHPEWSAGHSHADAKRVMVQKLVSDLWSAWRRATLGLPVEARTSVPASITLPLSDQRERGAFSDAPEEAISRLPLSQPMPRKGRKRATPRLPGKAESPAPASSLSTDPPVKRGRKPTSRSLPPEARTGMSASTESPLPRERKRRLATIHVPKEANERPPASVPLPVPEPPQKPKLNWRDLQAAKRRKDAKRSAA